MPFSISIPQELIATGHDFTSQRRVDIHSMVDLFARVQDSTVVAPAEKLSNLEERNLGLLAHQVHSYLARHNDMFVTLLAAHILQRDVVVFCYRLGNLPDVQVRFPAVVAK